MGWSEHAAMWCCVILFFLSSSFFCDAESTTSNAEASPSRRSRVPLYVTNARKYAKKLAAYETTMQGRMEALARTTNTFAANLYLRHVSPRASGRGDHDHDPTEDTRGTDNVVLCPLSVYATLAMTMTASRGATKRQVVAALNMTGEGRGVHAALQRALTSLREDDTADDVTPNSRDDDVLRDLMAVMEGGVKEGDGAEEKGEEDDEDVDQAGVMGGISDKDLENIIMNDYVLDSTISYNTGQAQVPYGRASHGHYRSRSSRHRSPGHISHSSSSSSSSSSGSNKAYTRIRLANALFHSEDVGLSQRFSNRLVSLYGVPPMLLPQPEPEVSVNLWVDAETRGAVPGMLTAGDDDVPADPSLLLVSAFAFRGQWAAEFQEKETVPLPFTTPLGDTVMVACMYRAGNYSVKTLDRMGGTKVLELPYANPSYSLHVFLPPRAQGRFQEAERVMGASDLQDLVGDMPDPAMTILMLPRFSLSATASVHEDLTALGVTSLFTQGQADLRRMTGEDERMLFANRLFQHASLQVDEGTGLSRGGSAGQKKKNTNGVVDISSHLDDAEQVLFESAGVFSNSSTLHHHHHHDHNTSSRHSSDHVGTADDATAGATSSTQDAVISEASDVMSEDDALYDDDYADEEYYDDYGDYDDDDETEDSSETFIVDRPFLFVLTDKRYGLTLLIGRVTNPLS